MIRGKNNLFETSGVIVLSVELRIELDLLEREVVFLVLVPLTKIALSAFFLFF